MPFNLRATPPNFNPNTIDTKGILALNAAQLEIARRLREGLNLLQDRARDAEDQTAVDRIQAVKDKYIYLDDMLTKDEVTGVSKHPPQFLEGNAQIAADNLTLRDSSSNKFLAETDTLLRQASAIAGAVQNENRATSRQNLKTFQILLAGAKAREQGNPVPLEVTSQAKLGLQQAEVNLLAPTGTSREVDVSQYYLPERQAMAHKELRSRTAEQLSEHQASIENAASDLSVTDNIVNFLKGAAALIKGIINSITRKSGTNFKTIEEHQDILRESPHYDTVPGVGKADQVLTAARNLEAKIDAGDENVVTRLSQGYLDRQQWAEHKKAKLAEAGSPEQKSAGEETMDTKHVASPTPGKR